MSPILAALGDIESVKRALVAFVGSSRFTDKLDAVNAAYASVLDGYATPAPRVRYDYERAVPEQYPCLEAVGVETVYDPESDLKAATHRVMLVWTVVGDREDLVTVDVERLVRATRDLCWRSVLDAAEGGAPLLVEREDYSPLKPGAQNPFMKGGFVQVAVATYAP